MPGVTRVYLFSKYYHYFFVKIPCIAIYHVIQYIKQHKEGDNNEHPT